MSASWPMLYRVQSQEQLTLKHQNDLSMTMTSLWQQFGMFLGVLLKSEKFDGQSDLDKLAIRAPPPSVPLPECYLKDENMTLPLLQRFVSANLAMLDFSINALGHEEPEKLKEERHRMASALLEFMAPRCDQEHITFVDIMAYALFLHLLGVCRPERVDILTQIKPILKGNSSTISQSLFSQVIQGNMKVVEDLRTITSDKTSDKRKYYPRGTLIEGLEWVRGMTERYGPKFLTVPLVDLSKLLGEFQQKESLPNQKVASLPTSSIPSISKPIEGSICVLPQIFPNDSIAPLPMGTQYLQDWFCRAQISLKENPETLPHCRITWLPLFQYMVELRLQHRPISLDLPRVAAEVLAEVLEKISMSEPECLSQILSFYLETGVNPILDNNEEGTFLQDDDD